MKLCKSQIYLLQKQLVNIVVIVAGRWILRPTHPGQHLVRVRQTHFLVGLQSGLTLDIVLEGLTRNVVVERSLRRLVTKIGGSALLALVTVSPSVSTL